ncbi:BTB/POZ domain-containing protein At5g03250-like [Primulina eburnea]|uniref:BTB/POZ domain-containing protein At5g03250-like n=1 Tax=Primulina eburnea TaxID=1245227 RepID=UPI003C6C89B0
MACMKLGTKEDGFRLEGQTWMCSHCIPSDISIEVEGTFFHLHKFPLLSRSGFLEKLIQDFSERMNCEDEIECTLHLDNFPGGAKSFLFIAKFCYDVKVELTARNVVSLRCASEHLQMTASYGEGNLISQTENFLFILFGSWDDTIKALETSEKFLPLAEELHIVSKGIDSLAMIACANTHLLSYSMAGKSMTQSLGSAFLWNGIHSTCDEVSSTEDGWYEDVAFLQMPLFKRLICAVHSKGMAPNKIAEMIIFYAKSHLPLNGRQLSFRQSTLGSTLPSLSDVDQRTMIEEIVMFLPSERGVIPTKFLLKLLRISKILCTSPSSREALERKIGAELDQALLEDLLIPNTCYSAETLYDVECIHRMVNQFMLINGDCSDFISDNLVEEINLVGGSHSLEPMTKVANLLDNYLAEVAPDVNLGLEKFISLAAAIPDYSRPLHDGIYRAIDIFLKAHPWLTDSEKEHLCRLMNYQKFSLEASTHAAHNERLPLRVIVQVLFFEQLHLRTSVAGWLFVSDNFENSQNLSGKVAPTNDHMATTISENSLVFAFDDMKERVSELEKEFEGMKQDIGKLVKNKGNWNNFCRRFGLKSKIPCSGEALQPPKKPVLNGKYKHEKCKSNH